MNYHRRALELIRRPDMPLDPARTAAVASGAIAVGVSLPAAVAEWYSVPDRSDLWRWYCGEHAPAIWRPGAELAVVGAHPTSEEAHRDQRDDYHVWWLSQCEVWVNPPVTYDQREWVKGPILPLMLENQGCWEWGVVLDGTPDPPAVISFGGGAWDICAASFSTYVYARLFDAAPLSPGGVGQHVRVEECVAERHRRAIREEFQIEPTTRGAGCVAGVFTERFSRPGQRFSFCNLDDQRFSLWSLSAADPAGLSDLIRRLSSILPALGEVVSCEGLDCPTPLTGLADGHDEIPF